MFPATGARSPFFALAVSAAFILILVFGVFSWHSPSRIPFHSDQSKRPDVAHQGTHEAIRLLFDPFRLEPDTPEVRGEGDEVYKLPQNPRFKQRFGKDLLILDLDTRPLESQKAYEEGKFEWNELKHVSGGVFNHYAYSMVHGYDYKFIQASNFDDRHPTWIKPSALANQIKKYKWIVFLDADATFRFMHLPIEWMLNYWDIQPQHSLTMAKDPWNENSPQFNSDRFNRTYTNTGFIVVQNNNKVQEILKAWHECPDDTRYKTCSEWKRPRFHEQSAFGEFVRYDYEDYIKELECAEANGYPGVQDSHCTGHFIRHYWFGKENVKKVFSHNIMNTLTLSLQKSFVDNTDGVVVKTGKNQIY